MQHNRKDRISRRIKKKINTIMYKSSRNDKKIRHQNRNNKSAQKQYCFQEVIRFCKKPAKNWQVNTILYNLCLENLQFFSWNKIVLMQQKWKYSSSRNVLKMFEKILYKSRRIFFFLNATERYVKKRFSKQ